MLKTSRKQKKSFNDLTPKEWTLLSKSVWPAREVSSIRESHHLEHGATFPVALAERTIKMYSKVNDLVLDPFSGVGSTLIAAQHLNRNAIGFELYENFFNITKKLLDQKSLFEDYSQKIINDDCRTLDVHIPPSTVQLTFTSPPYADFIQRSIKDRATTHKKSRLVSHNKSVVKQYGQHVSDFGNLSYDAFLQEVTELMKKIFLVTKDGGYNIWVVKDHRDPQHGRPLIPVHSDIAAAGEKAGFKYHDLITWDQNEQRSLVLLGYPTVFYTNINHSFLVVLRKTPQKSKKS